MKRTKKILWLILILAVVTAVVLVSVFWETLLIHIAPQTVLTKALTNTATQLQERFDGNPIHLLSDSFSLEGINSASMRMESENKYVGNVSCDLTVQAGFAPNRISADGTVLFSEKELAVSLYLDQDFAAFSSMELLNGNYYGITFDTFAKDITHFPLLTFLLPDATITKWETSVAKIQAQMGKNYAVPEISRQDIQKIMIGLLALKYHVSSEEILLNGQVVPCYKVSTELKGDTAAELLQYFLNPGSAESCALSADFYLYQNAVVKMVLCGMSGENSVQCVFALGKNAAEDELALHYVKLEDGNRTDFSASVDTQRAGELYSEAWTIGQNTVSYDWDSKTGELNISRNAGTPVQIYLAKEENGLRITTYDFSGMLDIFREPETGATEQAPVICEMVICKGGTITTPGYKNLDKWSMDDMLTLLKGVGSLIGINLN